MPLPFGHTLMGYALYETMPRETRGFNWRLIFLFAIIANLPDIDFLPGFIEGNPNKYHHHYFSHSLGFSLLTGSLVAWYFSLKYGKRFLLCLLVFSSVCYSHVILDLVTVDTSEPFGVPMFWPISNDYYYSSFSIFMSTHKVGASSVFLKSLFVMHNLWVVLWEIVFFIPVLTIIKVVKKRGTSQRL